MNLQTTANTSFEENETIGGNSNHLVTTTILKRRPFPDSPSISVRDALILKEILNSDGRISSLILSRKTELPLTSVQRYRKRIESMLIKTVRSPQYRAFGLHETEVDIKTEGGRSARVISELHDFANVVYLSRMHGDNRVSIRARIITRSNLELVHCLDQIESIDGVREISWSEIIEEIPQSADLMKLLNLSEIIENVRDKGSDSCYP